MHSSSTSSSGFYLPQSSAPSRARLPAQIVSKFLTNTQLVRATRQNVSCFPLGRLHVQRVGRSHRNRIIRVIVPVSRATERINPCSVFWPCGRTQTCGLRAARCTQCCGRVPCNPCERQQWVRTISSTRDDASKTQTLPTGACKRHAGELAYPVELDDITHLINQIISLIHSGGRRIQKALLLYSVAWITHLQKL